jgi:hypothetical protein
MLIAAPILENACRTFEWEEVGSKYNLRCSPSGGEGYPIDRCRLLIESIGINSFVGRIAGKADVSINGATSREVAEALYHEFYKILTIQKFESALKPGIAKKIIITGNNIKESEFNNAPKMIRDRCTVFHHDGRSDQIFVVGWPKLEKDTFITTIRSLKAPTGFIKASSFNTSITTEEGVKLHESLDWRIYNPQELVEGEVYCQMCKNLHGSVQQMGMRFVITLGPLCGPCIDHLMGDRDFALDNLMDV